MLLNNKETKELSVKKLNEQEEENNTNNNSFYNKNSNKKNTKWTQDWRGKSLGIFVSSIILISAAIPSGMAAAGYFSNNFGSITNVGNLLSDNKFEEIKNDINVAKNDAIIWQFDEMHKQKWFDDNYYQASKKRIKNDAKDSVQEKKDDLSKQYGDTWKDEYKKFLSELGFENDDEWMNSMIAEQYKTEEIKKFSNNNYIINTSTTDDDNWEQTKIAKYVSKSRNIYNSKETVKYINNAAWNGGEVESYSLTPEKFMDYFIKYYQPVLFNDSLLQFTPVSGGDSTDANISAGNIKTDAEKIYNSITFLQKLDESDGFTPAAINYQGIQSGSNIQLSDPITNISLEMLLDTTDKDGKIKLEKSGTTLDIKETITNALSSASLDINSNKDEVGKMTNDNIDKYEESILTNIKNLIGETNNKDRKFNSSTEILTKKIELNSNGTYDWKQENMEYATYISNDGLHVTGIQDSGKDLVINYLTYKNFEFSNSSIDSDFLFDNGLIEKFTSFVSEIYDNAALLSWLNSPDGDIENIGEFSENELKTSWISTIYSKETSKLIEKYDEAKEFFKSNENIYDYNEFIKIKFYTKLQEDGNLYKDVKKEWDNLTNNYLFKGDKDD